MPSPIYVWVAPKPGFLRRALRPILAWLHWPGTWTPFGRDGRLRADLEKQGWVHVGAMRDGDA